MSRFMREDSGDSLIVNGPRSEYIKRYPEHPVNRTKSYKPPAELSTGQGKIDSLTVQRSDYPEHPVQRRQLIKPENNRQELGAFDARPGYADDFPEWELPPRRQKEKVEWKPPEQPVENKTTTTQDYPEHAIQRRKPFKPDNNREELAAFDSHASYLDDFPEWELPPRRQKEIVEWTPPEQPVENKTTTTQDFPEHAIQRRKPFKPDNNREELAAFDAQPSYREEYPEWRLPPKVQREKIQWKPPVDPFQGTTTSNNDFPEYQVSPRVNHRPDMKPFTSDAPFYGNTDYHDTFREHPVQQRPRRERQTWQKPREPFDGTTTSQNSYIGAYAPKQPSMRPSNAPVASAAPLDGATTTSLSYKAYELPKRYKHEPELYKQPQGPMDMNTTMGTHYTEHALHRQTYERPTSSHLLRGAGEMSKTTNYQGDFVERPIERRKNMKPGGDYKPPEVPMDTRTTFQSDFFEKPVEKRESYRPNYIPSASEVPFQDRTVNRDTFVPHKVSPREQRQKEVYQGPTAPLEDRTTIRDSYKGSYQPPRESFKPTTNVVKSDIPFQANTTSSDTFKEHTLPEKYVHRTESYHRPEGPMDLYTTHGTNFTEHQIQRQGYQRPESSHLLKGHGEMSKSTNYQNHFQEPPPVKRQLAKRPDEYHPPTEPLDSNTTTRASYKEPGISPRTMNYKPHSDYIKSEIPFENRTMYRDRFTEYQVQLRQPIQRETHKPPSAPFEARTTTCDSYKGSFQPKRDSFKPNNDFVKSDIPFESNTTVGSTYKPWPASQRQRHRPDEYVKPIGNMDLTTINREAFKEVRAERQPLHKLGDSGLLAGSGKFETNTSYSNEFVPKSMAHRTLVKPDNQYVPSTMPFENNTTYRVSHLGYVAPKERAMKPDGSTDVLGQRDNNNRFRARGDWREGLGLPTDTVMA